MVESGGLIWSDYPTWKIAPETRAALGVESGVILLGGQFCMGGTFVWGAVC